MLKGFVEKVEFYFDIVFLVNRLVIVNDIKSEYFFCIFWFFSSIFLVVFLRGGGWFIENFFLLFVNSLFKNLK